MGSTADASTNCSTSIARVRSGASSSSSSRSTVTYRSLATSNPLTTSPAATGRGVALPPPPPPPPPPPQRGREIHLRDSNAPLLCLGKRSVSPSPSRGGQAGGNLDHLLMADALPTRPIDLVEAHVLPPGRRVKADRDADQAEADRSRPYRPRHVVIMALARPYHGHESREHPGAGVGQVDDPRTGSRAREGLLRRKARVDTDQRGTDRSSLPPRGRHA